MNSLWREWLFDVNWCSIDVVAGEKYGSLSSWKWKRQPDCLSRNSIDRNWLFQRRRINDIIQLDLFAFLNENSPIRLCVTLTHSCAFNPTEWKWNRPPKIQPERQHKTYCLSFWCLCWLSTQRLHDRLFFPFSFLSLRFVSFLLFCSFILFLWDFRYEFGDWFSLWKSFRKSKNRSSPLQQGLIRLSSEWNWSDRRLSGAHSTSRSTFNHIQMAIGSAYFHFPFHLHGERNNFL